MEKSATDYGLTGQGLILANKLEHELMALNSQKYYSEKYGVPRDSIYHATVMPCFDKKLEASRPDFTVEGDRDTNCVLTSIEVEKMIGDSFSTDEEDDEEEECFQFKSEHGELMVHW